MFFWPISEEEQPGDSDVFLHDVVFLIDRRSCVARKSRIAYQNLRYLRQICCKIPRRAFIDRLDASNIIPLQKNCYFAIGFYFLVRVFRNTLIPSVKMTSTMNKNVRVGNGRVFALL